MKPIASLSLDLDNQWSYMRTHGDSSWEELPSYLDILVPRLLAFLSARDLRITVFIVGLDAEQESNRPYLSALAEAGHEIGNHSHRHEQWLHLYSEEELRADIEAAENAILQATDVRPVGFRGPGFSVSEQLLEILADRGYVYDASTFPTFLGPLARAYYFRTSKLTEEQRQRRRVLFGGLSEGFRPLKPYRWRLSGASLVEVPVTTMPGIRTPFHLSYLLYLATVSPLVARLYFGIALRLCRLVSVAPSFLLHPLDFLGCDDTKTLDFFPAMRRSSEWKLEQTGRLLDRLTHSFTMVPMSAYLESLEGKSALRERTPSFDAGPRGVAR